MLTTGLFLGCLVLGALMLSFAWIMLGNEAHTLNCEDLLWDCEQQFRDYAEQHYTKATIESIAKGNVNRDFAERIAAILGDAK